MVTESEYKDELIVIEVLGLIYIVGIQYWESARSRRTRYLSRDTFLSFLTKKHRPRTSTSFTALHEQSQRPDEGLDSLASRKNRSEDFVEHGGGALQMSTSSRDALASIVRRAVEKPKSHIR